MTPTDPTLILDDDDDITAQMPAPALDQLPAPEPARPPRRQRRIAPAVGVSLVIGFIAGATVKYAANGATPAERVVTVTPAPAPELAPLTHTTTATLPATTRRAVVRTTARPPTSRRQAPATTTPPVTEAPTTTSIKAPPPEPLVSVPGTR